MNDYLVGLYNSFFSLGMIIGPLAGSYITLATSFRFCTDAQALAQVGLLTLYAIVIVIPTKIRGRKTKQQVNNNNKAAVSEHDKVTPIDMKMREELLWSGPWITEVPPYTYLADKEYDIMFLDKDIKGYY